MSLHAIASTLRSRRFWVWQIGGATIYAIPVLIRLATGNVVLPILSLLETPWIDHFVPGNLVEKILVGAFFPGGAGAVAGEIFLNMPIPKPTLVGGGSMVTVLRGRWFGRRRGRCFSSGVIFRISWAPTVVTSSSTP